MGRRGDNVEIRGDTMRISFYFEGKRHRPTLKVGSEPMKPTKANQLYAKRLVEEIRTKMALGQFVLAEYFPESGEAGAVTVTRQLDTWLAAQRIEDSTKAGYTAAANFWKNASYHDSDLAAGLGRVPLRSLKLSHILTAIARRPDLKGKTVNNYVSVLRESLELAVHDRLMDDNPATKVPRAARQTPPPDPFDATERDNIVERFQSKYPGQVANMVTFWMWTGLRTSEIFGLRWGNVDLRKGEVVISEAVVRGLHKDRTKTNVARTVKLNSRALEALKAQKAHTYLAGEQVFLDPRYGASGTPWGEERAFRRSFWTPVLKALGIRYRRPYNMRHTYATTMLMTPQGGMSPAFCARQLGHSVEMFLRTYSKWIDGDANDREMAKLESAIGPKLVPADPVASPK